MQSKLARSLKRVYAGISIALFETVKVDERTDDRFEYHIDDVIAAILRVHRTERQI